MFFNSGRYALILVGLWCNAAMALETPTANQWTSRVQQTNLGDSSVMTEYIAETPAVNSGGVWLQTAFIPRFSCTPLSAIRVANDHLWNHRFGADTNFALEFFVDEEPILVAINLDTVGNNTELTIQGDLQSRLNLQRTIDRGDIGFVKIDQYLQMEFSLLGSTDVHKIAQTQCRNHRATPLAQSIVVPAKATD